MSTDIDTQNPSRELVATLRSEQFQTEITAALPPDVTPAKFVRTAITALQASPDIIKCDRATILRALIESAQMGLMPDGREAALVGFGGAATLIPMVGGYRKIAAEHGWSIRSAVVYENDEFDYALGLDLHLTHRPARLRETRGEVVGAYAIATHRDGRKEIEVMTRAEIDKVREVSRSKDRGPWRDWFERMVEKTPVRRLFPKLPLDPADRRVARLIELPDTPGEAAEMLYGPGAGETFRAREITSGGGEGTAAASAPSQDSAAADVAASSADSGAQAGQPGAAAEDPDPEPEPPEEGQGAFQIPEDVVAQALATVVTFGQWQGKTLADVAAEPGHEYLKWCLRNRGRVPEELHAALDVVARANGLLD